MIAPLRESDGGAEASTRALRSARRAVAAVLMEGRFARNAASRVPAWKVLGVTLWVLAITASFFLLFSNWWRIDPNY